MNFFLKAMVLSLVGFALGGCHYYKTSVCDRTVLRDVPELDGTYDFRMVDEQQNMATQTITIHRVGGGIYEVDNQRFGICDSNGRAFMEGSSNGNVQAIFIDADATTLRFSLSGFDRAMLDANAIPYHLQEDTGSFGLGFPKSVTSSKILSLIEKVSRGRTLAAGEPAHLIVDNDQMSDPKAIRDLLVQQSVSFVGYKR